MAELAARGRKEGEREAKEGSRMKDVVLATLAATSLQSRDCPEMGGKAVKKREREGGRRTKIARIVD